MPASYKYTNIIELTKTRKGTIKKTMEGNMDKIVLFLFFWFIFTVFRTNGDIYTSLFAFRGSNYCKDVVTLVDGKFRYCMGIPKLKMFGKCTKI